MKVSGTKINITRADFRAGGAVEFSNYLGQAILTISFESWKKLGRPDDLHLLVSTHEIDLRNVEGLEVV